MCLENNLVMCTRFVRNLLTSGIMIVSLILLLVFSTGNVLAVTDNSQPPPDNSDVLCGQGSIDTAIGCIPVQNLQGFAEFFVGWFIGIAGGVAIVLMIYSGFLISTSSGNPKQVAAGKELLTAAISGLVLLIMSAYILKLIGIDILGILGSGGSSGVGGTGSPPNPF